MGVTDYMRFYSYNENESLRSRWEFVDVIGFAEKQNAVASMFDRC
jgi:hypothetical protein